MRILKPILAAILPLGLTFTLIASASAPAPQGALVSAAAVAPPLSQPFPLKLVSLQRATSGGLSDNPGVLLTWQASVPGLSFCVAYAGAHGVDVGPAMGHSHLGDRTHCLASGPDGKATDFVAFKVDAPEYPVLLATVVLVGNQSDTSAIQVDKLPALKR